jgi:hypothetical protein
LEPSLRFDKFFKIWLFLGMTFTQSSGQLKYRYPKKLFFVRTVFPAWQTVRSAQGGRDASSSFFWRNPRGIVPAPRQNFASRVDVEIYSAPHHATALVKSCICTSQAAQKSAFTQMQVVLPGLFRTPVSAALCLVLTA